MAQEGGPRDRADEERAWLNTEGVPDWREQEEAARYDALRGAESPSEALGDA